MRDEVFAAVFAFLAAVAGYAAAYHEVSANCTRIGGFYSGSNSFSCRPIEETRK